ncbi:MAG: YidC/Oxa1 family membrane protein insertase [Armatimonadota bacterium]
MLRRFPNRCFRSPWLLAPVLLLAALAAGCGSNVPVDPVPEKALAAGTAKEDLARKAEADKSADTAKLWTAAADYWNAMAKKFPGQAPGLRAAINGANITAEKLANPYNAWTTLRPIVRGSASLSLAEQKEAEAKVVALEDAVDKQNSQSPFYGAMDMLVRLFGNDKRWSPVAAITFIALFVTVVLWPLRYKTYKSAKEMQKHAPQIQEIQRKYKDDPMQLQVKMREFQTEHGVNPMGGCLPAIAQIPVFLLMIQLINNYQFSFRGATFLWINPSTASLSAAWPPPLNGQIGQHLGEQDLLLLILYALTMFLQMKLTPPPSDPTQAEQQKMMSTLMPVIYFVMMLQYQLPSAFVLYYFVSNLCGVGQQWLINRRLAVEMGPQSVVVVPSGEGGGATLEANAKLIAPRNRRKK